MMKSDVKQRWIAALRRSDETAYKQGKGRLRYYDKFCCMGVLCDTIDPKGWEANTSGAIFKYNGAMANSYPPYTLRTEIGLTDIDVASLSIMNDAENKTFFEIADWIEKNIPADAKDSGHEAEKGLDKAPLVML
jgi:hypothetical protein